MTILDCINPTASKPVVWYASVLVVGALFALNGLLSLATTIRFFSEVRKQRTIVTVAQSFLILAFFSKSITFLLSKQINSVISEELSLFFGLVLFETPCYIVTTCYSVTLLAWLSVCLIYLPSRYKTFAAKAHKTVIVVNIAIYLLFIVDLIIEAFHIGSIGFQTGFSAAVIVLRDMTMGIAFFVFLRCGFGVSNLTQASSQERRLFLIHVIFAIVLILRAAVVIGQVLVTLSSRDECSMGFYSVFMVNEIIIDFIPLSVLAFFTYSHLINRSSVQIVQITDSTVIDSQDGMDHTSLLNSADY